MRGDMESLSRDAVAARAAGEQRMRDDYQATQLELDSLRDEKELLTAIIAKQKKVPPKSNAVGWCCSSHFVSMSAPFSLSLFHRPPKW